MLLLISLQADMDRGRWNSLDPRREPASFSADSGMKLTFRTFLQLEGDIELASDILSAL